MWYKQKSKNRILFIDNAFYHTDDESGGETLIENLAIDNLESLGYEIIEQPIISDTHKCNYYDISEDCWVYEKNENSAMLKSYRKQRDFFLYESDKLVLSSNTVPQSLKEYRDYLKFSTEIPKFPKLLGYNDWCRENFSSNTEILAAEIENE